MAGVSRRAAILAACAAIGLAVHLGTAAASAQAADAPNLVIIFIDDLGYADVRPFGNPPYPTPHIAQMAAEGRQFTDFLVSSAVCSSSRAGLLTGCLHPRVGIHGALPANSPIGIHADETTLAELCGERGYATGCVGKWHLGKHPKFLPLQNGFDSYFGLPYSNDMWEHNPAARELPDAERQKRWPPLPLIEDERVVKNGLTSDDQNLLTRQYTEHAVAFIREHRDEPFFLYLAHSMVHVPLHVSDEFRGKSGAGLFGDAVAEVDWSVGQVLAALREEGLDERTLVIFTADNGPWLNYGSHAGSAAPLREGKGTSFEGGFRVATIMRWPGRIPAGTTCDELASTIDVLPTVAALIGAALPSHKIDGHNIGPLIFGEDGAQTPPHQVFPYYYDNQLQAIRDRRWKLHFPHRYRTLNGRTGRDDGLPIAYEEAEIGLELFDLKADRGETANVADRHPEIVEWLGTAAELMRAHLGDSLTDHVGFAVRPAGKLEPGDQRFRSMLPEE